MSTPYEPSFFLDSKKIESFFFLGFFQGFEQTQHYSILKAHSHNFIDLVLFPWGIYDLQSLQAASMQSSLLVHMASKWNRCLRG